MITITTKEAERFARWCDTDGFTERATALRYLAAERDALRAEAERLKAGGCARGQSTTQFCAEAVALKAENAKHVFGDECKAQRNKARAALGEKE